ncbi:MAG: DUF4142 domain-containing protein [Saprospiraceae bacterium]
MKTHSNLLSILMIAGLLILNSCNSRNNDGNTNTDGGDTTSMQGDNTATDTGTGMDDAAGKLSGDAEVLAMVMTVDMNEINAAAEARRKKLSQPVMEYANMMHTEHTRNLEKGRTLSQSLNGTGTTGNAGNAGNTGNTATTDDTGTNDISNMPGGNTEAVRNLQEKGANMLSTLTPLTGKDFERAYMDAMVRDHQEALNMLDNQLIPAAQNEALRNHLTETRQHVSMHLERARAIQGNMNM